MIWNQHLLYQIIGVWYHIRKLYLINNEKNDKIKLNHFFYKRRPITLCDATTGFPDVGETKGEIPYWLRVTTQIWVVLLID